MSMETKEEISVSCEKCGKVFGMHPTLKSNKAALTMHRVRIHSLAGRRGALLGARLGQKTNRLKRKQKEIQDILPAVKGPRKAKGIIDRNHRTNGVEDISFEFQKQIGYCPGCGSPQVGVQAAGKMIGREIIACAFCRLDLVPINEAIKHCE